MQTCIQSRLVPSMVGGMIGSNHQTGIWRRTSTSKFPGVQAGLWASLPQTEVKPCPDMQVHFICLQWKHFNISKFESICLDPSISWIFEAGRMASVRQGKHLKQFILIVFFQKAQRKGPMPPTFLACCFSCTEYPRSQQLSCVLSTPA